MDNLTEKHFEQQFAIIANLHRCKYFKIPDQRFINKYNRNQKYTR